MGRSFDEVFGAEFGSLHRYLSRRVGGSVADDLAAETFAIAYHKWAELDPSRSVRPWLYGVAANLVKHHRRKELRMLRAYARTGLDPTFGEQELSADRLDAKAVKADLAVALADLRAIEREVLLLHAWAQLSDSEIADALSLPLGTTKSHLSRARSHMRNRLSDSGKVETEILHTLEEVRR
jgi:RNA polymerase sigma factor (sigma-70 family)